MLNHKIFTFFVLSLISLNSFGQDVKCNDLIDYVVKKGTYKNSVFPIQLISSDWLNKVEAYSIENKIIVIAEIKNDELFSTNKKYIFCGIPTENWNAFYVGLNDLDKSFGERFHKYIFDYKCDCE
ncbi:hypothetical protein [Gelidibacter mesophilus]|uniref:hypothetical protein n=1 Tax=Gelidibacter mesophilus TaxID=169050 RepID=UPI0004006598|nr:hypothetical protein [Gelidibacter mesophilus]